MYFLDTNILLEIALEQEKADITGTFLNKIKNANVFISDLSIHSIGIILFNNKKEETFISLTNELILNEVSVVAIPLEKLQEVEKTSKEFKLDFDDAYQYCLAKTYSLQLISFDKDFDRTDIKRKEPQELLP